MCVIKYISRFDKVPNGENNVFLIDVTLTDKVKNWKRPYLKFLLSLLKNVYEYKPPASVINASKCYVDGNNDVLNVFEVFY